MSVALKCKTETKIGESLSTSQNITAHHSAAHAPVAFKCKTETKIWESLSTTSNVKSRTEWAV